MNIDATFWVGVSFFIFVGIIFYLKVPQKVIFSLNESIKKIKEEIDNAEKIKDDAKTILSEYETKVSKSKDEIKIIIQKSKDEAEKNLIKANEEFHNFMEIRKKNAEERIRQLKNQAEKDIKNASVKIAIESVEKLIKNSLDKSKLDKIYSSSIEETKLALKRKSS